MSKTREIRVHIPFELYTKFQLYVKEEYKKPTEFVKDAIIDYVLEKEREAREI